MRLEILNSENLEADHASLFTATVMHLRQWGESENAIDVELSLHKREKSGWLEYLAIIRHRGNGCLVMGCIERELGAKAEFHT